MARKINIVDKPLIRVRLTGRAMPRIEPAEFAAALGAEPYGKRRKKRLDLISLGELGNRLMQRLRSTGGRPALDDATERCKVPLSPENVSALEQIVAAIEKQTGTRPALGQIASVILRMHLEALRSDAATVDVRSSRS